MDPEKGIDFIEKNIIPFICGVLFTLFMMLVMV